MGNCCNANYNDNDLLNSPYNNKLENIHKNKDSSNDYQNQIRHNIGIENIHKGGTDSNKINEKKYLVKKIYIYLKQS